MHLQQEERLLGLPLRRTVDPAATLLGIEASGWTRSQSGNMLRVYSVMAALTQYLGRSGFFVSGGLGLIGFDESAVSGISGEGLGFSGRVGYEVGVGSLAIASHLSYARSLQGVQHDLTISNVQLGLSLVVP